MSAVCAASFGLLLILLIILVLHEVQTAGGRNTDVAAEITVRAEGEKQTGPPSAEQTEAMEIIGAETETNREPVVIDISDTEENTGAELLFAGDICIQDYIAGYYDVSGIGGIVDEELKELMKTADIMMANQEFAFSERGMPMEDKQYTFEIAPRYVSIFTELGIDIVSLANNHALDYGQEALVDSFDTLDGAGISYVGAGRNLERAKELALFEVNGMKIGFLAASRVIPVTEWNAGLERPGMLTTYDPSALIAQIEAKRKLCDILVVYVHWGVERNEFPEDYQKMMARQYIDAGADVVIGTHPHVMQGIEYYKGKLIAYSLGNYIFSPRTGTGALLRLMFGRNGMQAMLEPFDASAFPVKKLAEGKRAEFLRYMESISFGISIDEAGRICYTQEN